MSIIEGVIFLCFVRSKNVWLDGFDVGDHTWKTRGFRDFDLNKDPAQIQDLSFKRMWHEDGVDNEYEFFKPKRLPLKFLNIPPGFCTNDSTSTMKLLLIGTWIPKKMSEKTPQIIFNLNKTSDLFHWEFKIGNKKTNHMYEVWSRTNKVNNTVLAVNLTDMNRDLEIIPKFNLTVSCHNFPEFKTELNFWEEGDDPNGISRESQSWDSNVKVDETVNPDDVKSVNIEGEMEIEYAGFTQPACLSLTTNGLAVQKFGSDCNEDLETVCEHQSCYTQEGEECVFPFTYKEVEYHNCTSVDVYLPWCATGTVHHFIILQAIIVFFYRDRWNYNQFMGSLPARLSVHCPGGCVSVSTTSASVWKEK